MNTGEGGRNLRKATAVERRRARARVEASKKTKRKEDISCRADTIKS